MVESSVESESNFETGSRGACGRKEHHPALSIWRRRLAYVTKTQSNMLLWNCLDCVQCILFKVEQYWLLTCCIFKMYKQTLVQCNHHRKEKSEVTALAVNECISWVQVGAATCILIIFSKAASVFQGLRAMANTGTPANAAALRLLYEARSTVFLILVCYWYRIRPCVHSAQPQEWSRLTG